MAEETSDNKTEPKNGPDREQPVDTSEGRKTQEPKVVPPDEIKIIHLEPKIIPLKAREVKESEDVRADRERLTRLLESEER